MAVRRSCICQSIVILQLEMVDRTTSKLKPSIPYLLQEGEWEHLAPAVIVRVLHSNEGGEGLVRVCPRTHVTVHKLKIKCAVRQVWHLPRMNTTKLKRD